MMQPRLPIIPAVLVMSTEELTARLNFAQEVTDSVHLDLIDGQFVTGESLPVSLWPKLDLGYSEAHLMVENPIPYLADIKAKGVIRVIIHVESKFNLNELVSACRQLDLLIGFAVNPDTDLDVLKKYLGVSNYFQIMGVTPGQSGQRQDPNTSLAVTYLSKLPTKRLLISVDGGIRAENIGRLKEAGASYFVASKAIFGRGDWRDNLRHMLTQVENEDLLRRDQPRTTDDHQTIKTKS